ncbi:multicopper oxidase domain-containing protein [Parafilimonas sp.]|uniref:multicopper oxidase domain-containing protein n=1 Tax=Parafilimonas sp. TaxID=1969739 RepID=UPI0039E36CE8
MQYKKMLVCIAALKHIHMKYIACLTGLLLMGSYSFSQQFNHGDNNNYIPFSNFAAPVAKPTPLDAPLPQQIANHEKDIITKPVEAASSGIHFPAGIPGAKTVRYDLYITDSTVNYTGKKRKGIAVNGSIPAPTLVFTIGDTALIFVHNNSDEPTGVHWHGVQLANRMDGVPYLTQHPIPPHSVYAYKFPVVQSGTYWYHSHFSLQEQIGLYGALIFNKRTEPGIPTIPLVLSDWSDMKPGQIDRRLHTANDWFSIKKHSVQSYSEAICAGKLGVKLGNEWKRMNAMDVSDVYYERFFANGDTAQSFPVFKAGDKVRLRVVNGAASSYFWLSYSGGKITVAANDGNDVTPVDVDRLIIGPSETYDMVVTVPENMQYEFLATSEDRIGHASVWLGSGMKMPAAKLPRLKYFEGMAMMNKMMKMNGNMEPMAGMALQKMDMNKVMYPELKPGEMQMDMRETDSMQTEYVCPMHPEVTSDKPGKCPKCGMELEKKSLVENKEHIAHSMAGMDMPAGGMITLNYDMLKAPEKTTLPSGPWKELKFELTGNMNRYVWTLDNKTVSESDKILIKQGENVRIILYNNSMMRHPMHLHGHDFRLVNQYGEYSPMKNVVDILPMEADTLEFRASESGDWFFHCHILYHMMSGMGRIFSYENSPSNPEVHDPAMMYKMLKMDDRMFHFTAQNDFATNGNDGSLLYSNTRWGFQGEWRLGYNDNRGYEVETHFGRYIGKMQWLFPYVGIDWRYRNGAAGEKNIFGRKNTKDDRKVFHAGIQYTLPFLIVADASIDHTGNVRMQLSREDIPLTPRLRASFMVNSDREYSAGGRYILAKYFSASAHYDSDMGWGAGITFTY